MININLGISVSILILFFIIIGIGYVYIDESRQNNKVAIQSITQVNKTQNEFIQEWKRMQSVDSIRFNNTLNTLHRTYDLIVKNQHLIINLSDISGQNSKNNLNLTKFNRASLVDSNYVIREIAKQLNITGLRPFDASKIN